MTVHRLPRQLGWCLWVLAFVVSSALDWRQGPGSDPIAILMRAAMWGGLCSFLAALAGTLACLALGTNRLPEPAVERVPLPPAPTASATAAGGAPSQAARGTAAAEEDFGPYTPEQVAHAIRGQLATE